MRDAPGPRRTRPFRGRGPVLASFLLAATAAEAAAPLRVLVSPPTQWGWVRDAAPDSARARQLRTREAQLDYFRALGFTHATYGLDPDIYNRFVRKGGRWTYPADGRTPADSSLRAARRAAERRGLGLIPQLAVLSHQDAFITWLDSSLSEFRSQAEFRAFLKAKGLPPGTPDHVAALGNNPPADQFFEAQLLLIKRAWAGARRGPEYLMLGHDELGYDSVCFVKAGRTRGDPRTPSALVAAAVDRRAAQVRRILGDSVRILLYGDSFLPADLGERYGLAGEPETGKDGVLWILRHRYRLQDRILVVPWNYLLADGEEHYWTRRPYDRGKQLRLLERLGFGYLPGLGEHGGGQGEGRLAAPFALGAPARAKAAILAWIRTARTHPRYHRGYLYQIYEPWEACAPDGLCPGFAAPLAAFAAWTYAGPPAKDGLPPERLLERVDYRASRREGRWVPGRHYPRPEQMPPAGR